MGDIYYNGMQIFSNANPILPSTNAVLVHNLGSLGGVLSAFNIEIFSKIDKTNFNTTKSSEFTEYL